MPTSQHSDYQRFTTISGGYDMKSSRTSKRAGYGVLRGASNPRITVRDTAPINPIYGDIWVDVTTPGTPVWNYWDGSAWQN